MAAEVIIPQAELQRVYSQAMAERAREARRQKRVTLARNGTIFAQWVVIAGMAAGIASMLPLVRVEPVFVYTRDDGTVTHSLAWDSLPAAARENATLNTLWKYVECRESYASATAQHCWTVVSALSTKKVRDQFQGWFNRDNPESPQRIYGDRTVRVTFRSVDKLPGSDDAYAFHYDRTEQGGQPVAFTAPLRYRRLDQPERLPFWQRITFNAPAVQVWEYRGATQDGVGTR